MLHLHRKPVPVPAGFIPQYQTQTGYFRLMAKKNPAGLAKRGKVGGNASVSLLPEVFLCMLPERCDKAPASNQNPCQQH